MFTNINGLHGNRDELAIAATKFDVVACAETKETGRRHVSELLLPGFKAPTLLLRAARPNGLGMALFVRSGLSVSRQKGSSVLVVSSWLLRNYCYLFVVYRSPNTSDRVFDCLCEAMGSIQSIDPKSVFVLWLISTVTTQSGWDHASLMPMVWLLLISPLLLTVLNWLMVSLIELEVCWILFWRMFRIYVMCMVMVTLVGRNMRRLESHWIYLRLFWDLM